MNNQEKEELEKLVQKHCSELGEHVDSVQIFVSRHDGGSGLTSTYNHGLGNFYTRMAQIREWIIRQEEFIREEARVSQRNELE